MEQVDARVLIPRPITCSQCRRDLGMMFASQHAIRGYCICIECLATQANANTEAIEQDKA